MLIQNNTEIVPEDRLIQSTAELTEWLEKWRSSWEQKNVDAYISHYSEAFNSLKMNKAQWRAYKENLNAQYQQITVHISKPAILVDRDRAMIRFLQEYTSDQHADFGEKVLYVKKEKTGYRIVGEAWNLETSQVAREEIEATTQAPTQSRPAATSDNAKRNAHADCTDCIKTSGR